MEKIGRALLILALLAAAGNAVADCFYIGLRGFSIAKNPDVLFWNEIKPLIALEPGRFYSLAQERSAAIEVTQGKPEHLQGRLHYIPQHLITADGYFLLRFMVVDPDDKTADDTLLPLSERKISLAADEFSMGRRLLSLEFEPFSDMDNPQPNPMHFEFEIRRRDGECDQRTPDGILADDERRRRNELSRLLDRVLFFDKPHLVGGREYRPYRNSKLSKRTRQEAMDRALEVARVNGMELIGLGRRIHALRETIGYDEIWEEYRLLVHRLAARRMMLEYREKKAVKQMAMPTLAFHPDWQDSGSGPEQAVLADWSINIPGGTGKAAE